MSHWAHRVPQQACLSEVACQATVPEDGVMRREEQTLNVSAPFSVPFLLNTLLSFRAPLVNAKKREEEEQRGVVPHTKEFDGTQREGSCWPPCCEDASDDASDANAAPCTHNTRAYCRVRGVCGCRDTE